GLQTRTQRAERRRVYDGDAGAAAGAARATRPRPKSLHGRAGTGGPGPLLPPDEGADPARLLHVGDRLHAGAALRGDAGAVRAVRAVHVGRDGLGGTRVVPNPAVRR